jgi:glycosyltransferase involved in cell wall biosynthesis
VGHDLPWPVVTGGRVRDAQLLAAAATEWHIDAVMVAEPDVLARDGRSIRPLPGLMVHVFPDEGRPTRVPRRDSVPAREAIEQLCTRGVDAVHVEGSYMLDLLPATLLDRTVLVEHNIESDLVEQRRALALDGPTSDDVRLTRQCEERAWREVARLVMLTDEDAATVRSRQPDLRPVVVPNGWDHVPARAAAPNAHDPARSGPRMLFFANHRYEPNRDALRWLVNEVLPLVRRAVPDAELEVAGANLDAPTRTAIDRPGVITTGSFTDVTQVLDAADIVVCPLRVGGGIKVKMIEALRRGCAVVTTSIGAQGVHGDLRPALSIGDTAVLFASHVVRLCDPAQRAAARERLVAAKHDVPRWRDSYRHLSLLWHEVSVSDRMPR